MMFDDGKKPYVLVSAFKEDVKPEDVEQSTPSLALILDAVSYTHLTLPTILLV